MESDWPQEAGTMPSNIPAAIEGKLYRWLQVRAV